MKKGIIIAAAILLTVGTALFVGAITIGGSLNSMKPTKSVQETYPVKEAFTDIQIDTHESDIRFVPSDDGTCTVVRQASGPSFTCDVSVENGTLNVRSEVKKTMLEHLFWIGSQTVTVYLPSNAYRSLSVENRTGVVELPKAFTFDTIRINGSTGDIYCSASASGPIAIKTSTGDIELNGVSANALTVSATTADVKINGAKINGDVAINISTGRTEIDGLTCHNFRSEGSTGRMTLKDVAASGTLFIKRTTGDVRFEACDAEEIHVEASTGNVTGTLLSEKVFACKTSTGKVQVPGTNGGGKCEITTSTGNIRIELAGTQQP